MKALDKIKKLETRLDDNIQCNLEDVPNVVNTLVKKGYTITRMVYNGVIDDNRRVWIDFV